MATEDNNQETNRANQKPEKNPERNSQEPETHQTPINLKDTSIPNQPDLKRGSGVEKMTPSVTLPEKAGQSRTTVPGSTSSPTAITKVETPVVNPRDLWRDEMNKT